MKRRLVWFACALGALSACGKGTSDSVTATPVAKTETPTTQDTVTTVTNALAAAFPGTLALSMFPNDKATSLRLAEDAFDPNAKPLKEKIADQQEIANGTASSCLPDALGKEFAKGDDETCYEFDQDMIYGTNNTADASPRWLGTKDGKSASGEACLVSYTRHQVSQVLAIVDQTLGFGMAAICQQKKKHADAALPEIGASVDMAPALNDLFGDKVTITAATLERLADVDSLPVYRILIKATIGKDAIKRTIGIIHSPKDTENKEYTGTLYTVMEGVPQFGQGGQQQQQQQTPKYQHLSIAYSRTEVDGKKSVKAELRSGQIAAALAANAIGSDGRLDFNVGTEVKTGTLTDNNYGAYTGYNQANEAVDGITFVAFDLDADTNEGTLAYWKNPGGNYFENARGFNITIAKNETTGVLEGCATSGSASTDFSKGISIRRYLNDRESGNSLTLSPKGYWHPFMNSPTTSGTDADGSYKTRTQQSNQVSKWYVPSVTDATAANTFVTAADGSLITRQCFTQNATSGLYEIDTVNTTDTAGFEILDTGNTVNAGKLIALPPPPPKHDLPPNAVE